MTGFGVRVSPGGAKTFMVLVGKARKRVSLGRADVVKLADARQKAKDILAEHQLSEDDETATPFDDALEQFLKGYAEKNCPSTVAETERLLNRHLKPIGTSRRRSLTVSRITR